MTPQILIEEDDELDEQYVVDKYLAAYPIDNEDHLESDFNQELATESLYKEISDQK